MAQPQSRLAEIRKKFQKDNTSFVPTPESQFKRIKKSKQDHAKAIRIAKARAARYNMTLRSLAIKTNQDVTKMQRSHKEAKKEAQQKASKYNMTSRALPVSSVVSRKDQANIAKALGENVSPSVAKEVLSAVAHKRHDEDVQATTALVRKKPKQINVNKSAPAKKTENVANVQEKQTEEEAPNQKTRMELTEVGDALSSGDEDQLNKAILKGFLESNAPHLVPKVDALLDQYKEKLQELFDGLLKKFPDAPDAEVSGQQKADKEIADAVEENPKLVQQKGKQPESQNEPDVDDDEEDSMIITPDQVDALDPEDTTPTKPPVTLADPGAVVVEDNDEDDDSLIIDADQAFKDGYEKTIQAAEKNPEEAVTESLDRRKRTVQADKVLTDVVKNYKQKKSVVSLASVDSLVQADAPNMLEGGYIVAAELEETEEKEEPSRWAVQFQNKNWALKQKLLKQGLSKQQVDDLVENLDSNTSDML